jgi:uncharacterized membrane-anchored protein
LIIIKVFHCFASVSFEPLFHSLSLTPAFIYEPTSIVDLPFPFCPSPILCPGRLSAVNGCHERLHQRGDEVPDLKVPEGYRYLDAKQSNYVLEDLWGNPKSNSSLGMLFPVNAGPMTEGSYAFNIQYDPMGFVEDDDADDVDYDDLLEEMQKETSESNDERERNGYERVELVGWAAKPFYDKEKHILHWAKEIKFGNADVNTLNYNVRVLGRKGVLVINAISTMDELKEVNASIEKVTDIVTFAEGNKYSDFNPSMDKVAVFTVGGLVAGKVLAKAGFFAIIVKFGKVIIMAIAGVGATAWKWITGRRKDDEEPQLKLPEENS